MSVAVGRVEGQPHGFWMVVWKVQSEKAQVLLQPRFCIVRVAVGQAGACGPWARTRLAKPRTVARTNFIFDAFCCQQTAVPRLYLSTLPTWKSKRPWVVGYAGWVG
jgi:hypothetical protein